MTSGTQHGRRRGRRRAVRERPRSAIAVACAAFSVAAVGLGVSVTTFTSTGPPELLAGTASGVRAGEASDGPGERAERSDRSKANRPPLKAGPTPSPTPKTVPLQPPKPRIESSPKPRVVVPEKASGDLAIAAGHSGATGAAPTYRELTYRVEVEKGLPFDREEFAETAHERLTDRRGWQEVEKVVFRRTDDADADFRLILASPATTDKLCAPLDTGGEVSCRMEDKVVLNAKRWAFGVPAYAGKLDDYRSYLVNHEVGHRLGHDHADCDTPGKPAPIMMQQTKGIGECTPNPWPSVRVK